MVKPETTEQPVQLARTAMPDKVGLLGRGVAWNWIGFAVTGGASFFIVPIMIRAVGPFYFGIWMLAYSILSYYTLFDFGLSTSVQRFVARSRGSGDHRTISETVSSAVVAMTVIGVLVCVTTICVAAVLPRLKLVPIQTVPFFRTVLLLLATSVAISFPERPAASYLRGIHRFDLSNGISAGAALIRAVAIWTVLRFGYGIIAVCLVTLCVSTISLVAHLVKVRILDRHVLQLSACRGQQTRQLGHFSIYVFFTSIGDYFRFQMDLLVVAKWIGVALVTPYSVAASVMAAYQNVMAGLSGPLMTELIRQDGAGSQDTYSFFLRASKVTTLLASLGATLLLANGRQLLGVWLGPGFLGVFGTLAVLTIAHCSDRAQAPSMHLLYSRGRHKLLAYWTIAEGVCNLVLSIALAKRFGILGVAIGTAIPMLVIKLVVQPLYTLHVASGSLYEYVTKAILPSMAISTVVILSSSLTMARSLTFSALVINLCWQTIFFAALAYVFALSRDERAMVSARLGRIRLNFQPRTPEQA
jgi:O-antigen/teichoic acid export membrane protein